jgi:hypothetical protein
MPAAEPEFEPAGGSATPLSEFPEAEIQWDHSTPAGDMPGIPRPVRAALSSPLLEPIDSGDEVSVDLASRGEPDKVAAAMEDRF